VTFVSHAQNFEDVMLWRSLREVSEGFYIDIGAHDPKIESVTHAFYERGWRGINVEPVRRFFEALQNEREFDLNINCAVGDAIGEIDFWSVEGGGLSTAVKEQAARHRASGNRVTPTKVDVRTLESICDDYVQGRAIHFLKIDVEGFEENVLKGANFERYRPWIVVVEATLPMSQVETHQMWEHILLNSDYLLCYKDGLNRFYLAKEKEDLLSRFTYPPNYFDDFVVYSMSEDGQLEMVRWQHDLMANSLSWRITAPLRRIKDIFRLFFE
jgi:FkbM family methyltransferase